MGAVHDSRLGRVMFDLGYTQSRLSMNSPVGSPHEQSINRPMR